ncbi:MAG TPA: phosphoribosylglycinamide formyltransferase [Aestuariivirgaceae bacterium]|nr:phosphoribosylglycinamide formyltransferase [Aestuariivirgaceae bacterium]
MAHRRTAVLISGRGSNLQALLAAARAPDYPAEIVLVISNRPDAAGLALAREANATATAVDHKAFATRAEFDAELDRALRRHDVELIACAGFMRILTAGFLNAWAGKIINIHPALLPLYKGLDTHGRALADGVRVHGCTVHYVVPEIDSGPIIAQAAVPVLSGDTAETLAARVLEAEHRLYPLALALVAEGRARLEAGKVVIDAPTDATAALYSPKPRL